MLGQQSRRCILRSMTGFLLSSLQGTLSIGTEGTGLDEAEGCMTALNDSDSNAGRVTRKHPVVSSPWEVGTPPRKLSVLVIGNLHDDPIPQLTAEKVARVLDQLGHDVELISGESLPRLAQPTSLSRFRQNQSAAGLSYESLRRQMESVVLMRRVRFDVGIVLLPFL